ncbi:MAG: hypothetical protein ACRD4W_07275 [Nitrososphaeraceae archaeon]
MASSSVSENRRLFSRKVVTFGGRDAASPVAAAVAPRSSVRVARP